MNFTDENLFLSPATLHSDVTERKHKDSYFELNLLSLRKGSNRYLTISKKDLTTGSYNSILKLSSNACQHIEHLSKKFPLNIKERQELQPKTERSAVTFDSGTCRVVYHCFIGLSTSHQITLTVV